MIEKTNCSDNLKTKQDIWDKSPCSQCYTIHCCENLPLSPLELNSQKDFINLILSSSYNGIYTVLKRTGEWTFYLKRDCSFLNKQNGKCMIHKSSNQSKICKSYDAHTCWYVEAFNTDKFSTMIPFNTQMIIWYEKKYKFIDKKFNAEINWEELCTSAYDYRLNTVDIIPKTYKPYKSFTLSFNQSRSDQFLFLPPYNRPNNMNQFELISFRLGFPGIYLAITDSCWAFMIKTNLNQAGLNLIKGEYYPSIEHKDGKYSFDSLIKEHSPFSETGKQWIILQRSHLQILMNLTIFDTTGRVKKIPTSSDILNALKSKNPNQAA